MCAHTRAQDKDAVKYKAQKKGALKIALQLLCLKIYALNVESVAVFLPYVHGGGTIRAALLCLVYFGGGNASGGGAQFVVAVDGFNVNAARLHALCAALGC